VVGVADDVAICIGKNEVATVVCFIGMAVIRNSRHSVHI
jgi:hypothetical protein